MTHYRLVAILAVVGGALCERARAGEMTRGFTFCAPPTRPACVDKVDAEPISCDNEVQAYTATVFKYRECLEVESERAVRDANDVIETWKCRTGKKACRD